MATLFTKIKRAYQLFNQVDFNALEKLSSKIDLQEALKNIGKLDDRQLAGLMHLLDGKQKHREPPPIDGDFYNLSHTLNEEERALQLRVRRFMESEVKPIVDHYWLQAVLPFDIFPKLESRPVAS